MPQRDSWLDPSFVFMKSRNSTGAGFSGPPDFPDTSGVLGGQPVTQTDHGQKRIPAQYGQYFSEIVKLL